MTGLLRGINPNHPSLLNVPSTLFYPFRKISIASGTLNVSVGKKNLVTIALLASRATYPEVLENKVLENIPLPPPFCPHFPNKGE